MNHGCITRILSIADQFTVESRVYAYSSCTTETCGFVPQIEQVNDAGST